MSSEGRIAILMLEDSDLDAELIFARLAREEVPFQAQRVTNEEEFRTALFSHACDLILSDFSLPGFNGTDALKIAHEIRPHIPFIFVSGALGEQIAIDLLKRGATDYVLKDRLERLAPAMRRALGEAQERKMRQSAELALQQSESRYRLLAEAAPLFVWTRDKDGNLTFVNQQFSRYTGISPTEVLEGNWESCVHPADLETVKHAVSGLRAEGKSHEYEFRCRSHEDGIYRWHFAKVVPLYDEEGSILQWLGTAINIDTQKRAEEALRRSNEELQQFAFAASHDLQEPLRNVATFTQLLARRFEHQIDAEADEYIRYAVDGAKRMNVLINDLLAYARIATQEPPSEKTSLEEPLAEVLLTLRTAIAESGAEITHERMPEVVAHPLLIGQVFQNLLSNSIKYRDPNRALKISIEARQSSGEWIFHVRDNGQGFQSDYAEKIFGVFQRLHGREVPGTGIGLSICKRIIERHRGRIWAESEPGQGAVFSFALPAY